MAGHMVCLLEESRHTVFMSADRLNKNFVTYFLAFFPISLPPSNMCEEHMRSREFKLSVLFDDEFGRQ